MKKIIDENVISSANNEKAGGMAKSGEKYQRYRKSGVNNIKNEKQAMAWRWRALASSGLHGSAWHGMAASQ